MDARHSSIKDGIQVSVNILRNSNDRKAYFSERKYATLWVIEKGNLAAKLIDITTVIIF